MTTRGQIGYASLLWRRLRRTTSSPVLFSISLCVTSAILHDHITALEVNGIAVIEFKPNLALEGYGVKP